MPLGSFGVIGQAVVELIGDNARLVSDIEDSKKTTEDATGSMSDGMAAFVTSTKTAGEGLTKTLTPAALAAAAASKVLFNAYHAGFETIRADTGATGEDLERLVDSAKRVAGQVVVPFEDVASVLSEVHVRTKLEGEALEALTKQVLLLSEATGTDGTANVETYVKLLTSWKVATEDQAGALDLLFRAQQATGNSVTDIAANATAARIVLQQLGFTFEETIALSARLGSAFPQVVAAMKIGIANLSKDPDIKNIPEAFDRIIERIEGAGSAAKANRIAIEAFGSRAGPTLAAQIREGRLSIEDFTLELASGSDTAASAVDDTRTLGDQFLMLKSRVVGAIGPMGETAAVIATIASGIGPFVVGISKAAGGVSSFGQQVRGLQGWLAAGGEAMSTGAASARVLGSSTAGLAGAGGVAVAGLSAFVLFLETRHQQALQEARDNVLGLFRGLDVATTQGPDAVKRMAAALAEDLNIGTGDFNLGSFQQLGKELVRLDDLARSYSGAQRESVLLQRDLVLATIASADAVNEHGKESSEAASAEANRKAALAALIAFTKEQAGADREGADATRESGRTAGEAAWQVRQLAKDRRDAAAATREQRDAELDLVGGFRGVQSALYRARAAARDYTDAQAEVNRLEARGKQGTDKYAEAVRSQRDAQLTAITAQRDLKSAVAEYSNKVKEGDLTQAQAIARIERMGARAGVSKGDIERLTESVKRHVAQLDEIPDKKTTRIEVSNASAVRSTIATITAALTNIPDEVVRVITVGRQGQLPGAAAGGITQGPTVLVGEGRNRTFAGPGAEAVIPLDSRGIGILTQALRSALGDVHARSGGPSRGGLTVHVHGNLYGSRDVVRAVRNEMWQEGLLPLGREEF